MLVTIATALLAALGIGLVIFVHELGHFLVAKAVGIRVEAFSIGFGPRLIGFRRGDTDYRICAFPVGGYVKMAGEGPKERGTGAPDEFASKTVSQRAAVVSAGVIMNGIFAFIVFPIVFSAGVPFEVPVAGSVESGAPAWDAGILPGDHIATVDGKTVYSFQDVTLAMAFADGPVEVGIRPRIGGTDEAPEYGPVAARTVAPRYSESRGVQVMGVGPAFRPLAFREGARAVAEGAATASERIVAVNAIPATQVGEIERELQARPERPFTLTLGAPDGTLRDVVLAPRPVDDPDRTGGRRIIGVSSAQTTRILRVQPGTTAAALGLRSGDTLIEAGTEGAMSPFTPRTRLVEAAHGAFRRGRDLILVVEREGGGDGRIVLRGPVGGVHAAWRLHAAVEFAPEPGGNGVAVFVDEGSPAALAGLEDRARIRRLDGRDITDWAGLLAAVRGAKDREMEIVWSPFGDLVLKTSRVTPAPVRWNSTLDDLVRGDVVRERVRVPFPASIGVGLRYAVDTVKQVFLTLRGLFARTVSSDNIGGIILIGEASYAHTKHGLTKILYFLAILSINLAIINLLPIPVLDGGWLLFLLIEKVRGRPLSERAMSIAQYAGVAVILSLLVFVTYNDIRRLFTH